MDICGGNNWDHSKIDEEHQFPGPRISVILGLLNSNLDCWNPNTKNLTKKIGYAWVNSDWNSRQPEVGLTAKQHDSPKLWRLRRLNVMLWQTGTQCKFASWFREVVLFHCTRGKGASRGPLKRPLFHSWKPQTHDITTSQVQLSNALTLWIRFKHLNFEGTQTLSLKTLWIKTHDVCEIWFLNRTRARRHQDNILKVWEKNYQIRFQYSPKMTVKNPLPSPALQHNKGSEKSLRVEGTAQYRVRTNSDAAGISWV